MDPQDRIQIGVVGKPHGVRGGFYIDGAIDAAALVKGLALWIAEAEFTVASRGGTDKRPLVILDEVGSREAAAALRGEPITARRCDLTPLTEGEWFADDLVGLAVVDRSGRALGTVTKLRNLPSVDVLEVAVAEGDALQLPMVRDAIIAIEPGGAGVTVDAEFLGLG